MKMESESAEKSVSDGAGEEWLLTAELIFKKRRNSYNLLKTYFK